MKLYIILVVTTISLLFSFFSYSQDMSPLDEKIQGRWIRTHSEMKDSSRVIRYTYNYHAFIVYIFESKEKGYATTNPLQGRVSFDYTVIKNKLVINGEPYIVESITDSTLVLCEAHVGISNDKLHRNYYKRLENYTQGIQIQSEQDSIYTYSKILFPIYKGKSLSKEIEDAIGETTFLNEIKVQAIITKKGEVRNVNILDKKSLSKKKVAQIISKITATNGNWIPAKIKSNPIDIKVVFIFNTLKVMSINMVTIKNEYINNDVLKELDYKVKEKAGSYFQTAISSYQKGNLEKAVKFFTKCIDIDETFVDAYYNRAAINLELGDKESACKDWQYLMLLEQKLAKKYFEENCMGFNK